MIRGQNIAVQSTTGSEKTNSETESSFRIDEIANAPIASSSPSFDVVTTTASVDDKSKPTRKRSRIPTSRLFYILLAAIALRLLLALRVSPDSNGPARRSGLIRRRRRNYSMLPQPGEYAPLTQSTNVSFSPLERLLIAPTRDYHVFVLQGSPQQPPTLLNLLMGLLENRDTDEHVAFVTYNEAWGDEFTTEQRNQLVGNNATIVSQTLETELKSLQRVFRKDFEHLFFVAIGDSDEMPDCSLPPDNLLCLQSSDVFYEIGMPLSQEEMISKFVATFQSAFPYFSNVSLSVSRAMKRLRGMERMMKHMKDVPSSTFETKYGIYGALT